MATAMAEPVPHSLDTGAIDELAALWAACGLTRPWNDPVHDALRAIGGPSSAIIGLRDGFDAHSRLIASVMVGDDGHRGWVYYVAVAPDRRREGLGRTMMTAAETWLRDRRALKLQLMVRDDNETAIAFYESLGLTRQKVVTLGRFLLESPNPPPPPGSTA